MAGFGDENRGYTGIFTVSYMLDTVFEKTKECLIILVVDDNDLLNHNLAEVGKPFKRFIKILKLIIDLFNHPSDY